MSKQTIGLDIGTHAVRAVEVTSGRGRPVIRRLGQVTLPAGAVVAGEVLEPKAVSTALRRLWSEVGFGSRDVVVGVANAKTVARLADLPALPEDELRSSLRFHVQDLIPMAMDESELDFQLVERITTDSGEERDRVLLVAGHRGMLDPLLTALEGAGLTAERIDLVPLALVRAVHDEWDWAADAIGRQEVVVSVGAGVTNVIVHEEGMPRFVRTLPSGGGVLTDALARDLDIDGAAAEAQKRALGTSAVWADRAAVEAAVAGPLGQMASDITGSLDFHLAQSESGVRRVVLTGAGARLGLLRDLLHEQIGEAVVSPKPFAGLDTSKVRLPADTVADWADAFTVAVGLALPSEGQRQRPMNLLPARIAAARAERRHRVLAGAGVAALAALLLGVSVIRADQVDTARHEAELAEDRRATLQERVGGLRDIEDMESTIAAKGANVTAALDGDVAWTGLIDGVTAHLPEDVWVTSFSATRGQATAPGTVQLSAVGSDHTSTARWLLRAAELNALADPWVTSSTRTEMGEGRRGVEISATANLGPGSLSERVDLYLEDGR